MSGRVVFQRVGARGGPLGSGPDGRWAADAVAGAVLAARVPCAFFSRHDASYVAVAEMTGAAARTLDRRLARAPGLRCAVATP